MDLDLETMKSLFADDTSAWTKDGVIRGSQRQLTQEEIDKIMAWAQKWRMKVSGSKTKSMVISSVKANQMWDP